MKHGVLPDLTKPNMKDIISPFGLQRVFSLNKRSTTADEYRKHYFTKDWRLLRVTILTRDGYRCQKCDVALSGGRSNPNSAVVHHKIPHKGDLELFYDPNNLEAVCWKCHSGALQSEEVLGYSKEIGADGWPTDPKHPGTR